MSAAASSVVVGCRGVGLGEELQGWREDLGGGKGRVRGAFLGEELRGEAWDEDVVELEALGLVDRGDPHGVRLARGGSCRLRGAGVGADLQVADELPDVAHVPELRGHVPEDAEELEREAGLRLRAGAELVAEARNLDGPLDEGA